MLYTVFACGFPSTCTGSRPGLTHQPPNPQWFSENPKIRASALEAKREEKMTHGWVIYGGMRHAEPQREMFPRSYGTIDVGQYPETHVG